MNKTKNYEFCIIVPIYNEEDGMDRLSETLAEYIARASVKTCALYVNDGSKDNSLEKIIASCEKYQDMFFINFAKNCGLSAAIKAGIDVNEAAFTGYIDADLQTLPEDFELLLPHRNDFELVTGIRAKRKDSLGKKLSSKIANNFRRMMTHDGIEDTGCPLKIINSAVAKRIPFFKGMHRFLGALILLENGKTKQIVVRHFERIAGQSKFNLWNRLIGPLLDCFAYRWMKKRYINYVIANNNIDEV